MDDNEIVAMLQRDMQAAHKKGIHIEMSTFGIDGEGEEKYRLFQFFDEHCSVCAIGACLLGKEVGNPQASESVDFAGITGHSLAWAEGFISGTVRMGGGPSSWDREHQTPEFIQGWELAATVARWVDDEKAAGRL